MLFVLGLYDNLVSNDKGEGMVQKTRVHVQNYQVFENELLVFLFYAEWSHLYWINAES